MFGTHADGGCLWAISLAWLSAASPFLGPRDRPSLRSTMREVTKVDSSWFVLR